MQRDLIETERTGRVTATDAMSRCSVMVNVIVIVYYVTVTVDVDVMLIV